MGVKHFQMFVDESEWFSHEYSFSLRMPCLHRKMPYFPQRNKKTCVCYAVVQDVLGYLHNRVWYRTVVILTLASWPSSNMEAYHSEDENPHSWNEDQRLNLARLGRTDSRLRVKIMLIYLRHGNLMLNALLHCCEHLKMPVTESWLCC